MVHRPDDFSADESSDTVKFEWLTDKYDPHTIYNGSTNLKGFSRQGRYRTTPEISGMMAEFAASRLLDNIRTPQHIIADSIPHRLRTYSEMVEGTDPVMARRLMMTAERARVESAVDRINQQRKDDELLAKNTKKMLHDNGPEVLAVALQARNTCLTECFQQDMDRELAVFRSRWGL